MTCIVSLISCRLSLDGGNIEGKGMWSRISMIHVFGTDWNINVILDGNHIPKLSGNLIPNALIHGIRIPSSILKKKNMFTLNS